MPAPPAAPGPEALMQLQFSMAGSRILATAVRLAVFTHLDRGARTAADVARAAGASERGTRMILDALAALVPGALVTKSGDHYAVGPLAKEVLVQGSPSYMGDFIAVD